MFGYLGRMLPPASQGQEQVDLVHRDLAVRRCQRGVGGGQRAVRVEAVQVRRAACQVKPAVLLGRLVGTVARGAQRGVAIEFVRVRAQRALRFAERLEHHAIEVGQGGVGTRLGAMDARAHAAGRQFPREHRAKAPMRCRRGTNVFQDAGKAGGRTNADRRIQVGRGQADARGGGRKLTLRLPHVGPPLEQRGAIAHRQGLAQARLFLALGQRRIQRGGRLADHHGKTIAGTLALGLEARQAGPQRVGLGLGAQQVGGLAAARVDQLARDGDAVLLQVELMPGHFQLVIGRAALHVGAHGLGDHAYPRHVERSLAGLRAGERRFVGTVQLAEEIDQV
jgi:hypothetical protein